VGWFGTQLPETSPQQNGNKLPQRVAAGREAYSWACWQSAQEDCDT